MRKDLWLFLAKLVPLTLVLGYFWFAGLQEQYPYLMKPVAFPFFELVGVKSWRLALLMEHFTNIVPYIALILASPNLITNWKRSLIAFFGGLLIIVAVHLLLSWVVYYFSMKYSLSKTFYKILVPCYLVNDAMPLILWLAFYPKLPKKLFGFRWLEKQAS